jgi:hypothetical protein
MEETREHAVFARQAAEGSIPLVSIEGEAYDCGREYAEFTMRNYPGFREYLDMASEWTAMDAATRKLFEKYAPQLIDVHRGIVDAAGPPEKPPIESAGDKNPKDMCTAFSLAPSVTLDGIPISGQCKDSPGDRVPRYIVLRMRIKDAPTIFVLCYPGEIQGYGIWSTGMTLTRHDMGARKGGERKGPNLRLMAMLGLASGSVDAAVELYKKHAGPGGGGYMFSEPSGRAAAIDVTASAVGVRYMEEGILTRSNHPEAAENAIDWDEKAPGAWDTIYRTRGLYKLFYAERGRLTAQKAYMIMADHSKYPAGQCKHSAIGGNNVFTTCLYVAEPTRGRMHVVRGQPCSNWPAMYGI